MNQQHLSDKKSKPLIFILKSKPHLSVEPKNRNIFSVEKKHIVHDLDELNNKSSNLREYSICGNPDFKTKFFHIKKKSLHNNKNDSLLNNASSNAEISLTNDQQKHYQSTYKQKSSRETIYMSAYHRGNFLSTLQKTQQNMITRENYTLQKFKQTQKSWQKIDSYLKLCIPKSQTCTFSSVNKVYVEQNPQKLEIINDMIPNYWQNSLRNNNIKLKSHLKGHRFTPKEAEKMLQTMGGTKKLQKSIPRIGIERFNRQAIKSGNFSLKAKSLQKKENCQTMRQFHKKFYKALNQNIKQRSLKQSSKNSKSISSKTINHNFIKKEKESTDTVQLLTEKEKKMYIFCQDLQNLQKIDHQNYIKSYDKRTKWIHQGLAAAD